MAKKFKERRTVFQFKKAIRTQCQPVEVSFASENFCYVRLHLLNFSFLTSSAASDPCESRCMRKVAPAFSSSVKNFDWAGVCGKKKIVRMPKSTVMPPSTKKINGHPLYPLVWILARPVASRPPERKVKLA